MVLSTNSSAASINKAPAAKINVVAKGGAVVAKSGVVAAKEAASARSRVMVQKYRGSANSVDAMREKVRREMKAEAAASKAKAMEKIEKIEAVEAEKEAERDAERRAREAARKEALELATQAAAEMSINNDEEPLSDLVAEEGADNEAWSFGAGGDAGTEAAPEPSHMETVQQLLAERAARRAETAEVEQLRQRAAARRLDPARFAPATSAAGACRGRCFGENFVARERQHDARGRQDLLSQEEEREKTDLQQRLRCASPRAFIFASRTQRQLHPGGERGGDS